LRRRLHDEFEQLGKHEGGTPTEISLKAVKHLDVCEMERRRGEDFTSYGADDVLDTFPVSRTIEPRLVSRVLSEIGDKDDYQETVQSLWWEASRNWSIISQMGIKKNSKILKLLGINPDDEPDMGQLINNSLDFAMGQLDDKLTHLVRWVMGRMLVSQFLEYAYSKKEFVSLETPVGDGFTVGDTLSDSSMLEELSQKEDDEIVSMAISELPAAQREALDLFLRAESPQALRQELGEREYKNKERNFERALKKLEDLRESGKLGT